MTCQLGRNCALCWCIARIAGLLSFNDFKEALFREDSSKACLQVVPWAWRARQAACDCKLQSVAHCGAVQGCTSWHCRRSRQRSPASAAGHACRLRSPSALDCCSHDKAGALPV